MKPSGYEAFCQGCCERFHALTANECRKQIDIHARKCTAKKNDIRPQRRHGGNGK